MVNAAWTGRIKAIIVGLGLGLAFLTSINWWNIYAYHVPKCPHPNCVADFVAIYAQALLIWENPTALYDANQQAAYQKRVAPMERELPSPYPPFAILLHAPLAFLSFSNAFIAFSVVNMVLLGIVIWRLCSDLRLTIDQKQWLLLFALCNFGVHAALSNSQSSMIVLYFFNSHVLALRRGKEFKAGIWAGMLCFKPQYLAIPHFLLLIHRRPRGFMIGVLLATFLTAGAFFLLGQQTFVQYLQVVRLVGTENSWINPLGAMHNLKALTGVWLPPPWHYVAWFGSAVLALSAVVWLNIRARRLAEDFEICWIGNSLALLLLTPHLFAHDLTVLIVPCALLLSLSQSPVSPLLGIGLVSFAMLPAVNYLFPTIMALALVLAFTASLFFTKSRLARI
jgi:hypothetical protein